MATVLANGASANGLGADSNRTVARSVSPVTISNSTVETSIGSYTVPANNLGPDGAIRVTVGGYFLNNTGDTTNRTMQLRIKFGGATIYSSASASPGSDADQRPVFFTFVLNNVNATNVQKLVGLFGMGNANAPTAGFGNLAAGNFTTHFSATAAIDTTAAALLDMTVELGSASSSLQFIRDFLLIERI